jgi:hypothetical protein
MTVTSKPGTARISRNFEDICVIALFVGTAPLWVSLVVLVAVAYFLRACALYLIVWIWWIGEARSRVLFVYSESPNWKQHIEEQVLPRLPGIPWSSTGRAAKSGHVSACPSSCSGRLRASASSTDRPRLPQVRVRGAVSFLAAISRCKAWQRQSLKTVESALFERLQM